MGTEINKEIRELEYELGQKVANCINLGISSVKKRFDGQFHNEEDVQNIVILIPFYMIAFLDRWCQMQFPNREKPQKDSYELQVQGIKVGLGYEENKIVVFHKEFPTMGVRPFIYELESEVNEAAVEYKGDKIKSHKCGRCDKDVDFEYSVGVVPYCEECYRKFPHVKST